MMVKIKTAVFTIIIALLLFGVFLSFVSNSNLGLSMTQYQGVTENVPNTQEDNDIRKTNQKLEGVLFYQQQVIEIRNNISRLLNAKQHELARLQCEVSVMSRIVTKLTKWHVHPAKTQISLCIRPVWTESLLCAQWVAKNPNFFKRTAKTLIRLGECPGWSESLLGAHAILLVLSRCGSYIFLVTVMILNFRTDMSEALNKHCRPRTDCSAPFTILTHTSSGPRGGGGNSLYFVWYRRAAGIAPIFQVIYTSIGHDFISNIHL